MKTAKEMRDIAEANKANALFYQVCQMINIHAEDGSYSINYLVEDWFQNEDVFSVQKKLTKLGYTVLVENASAYKFKLIISW